MVTDNMKTKFNLVGNTFTHLTNGNKGYSVHGKESQYIEWVQDGGEATFYIDDTINDGVTDKRVGPKYLWLLESKFIKPGLVESIIQNRELVENTYEVIFTHDQRLLNLGDKFKWVPAQGFWIKEPKIYEKSKMIYFSARGIENTARVDFYSIGFDGKNLKRLSVGDYNYSAIYLAPDTKHFVGVYSNVTTPTAFSVIEIAKKGAPKVETLGTAVDSSFNKRLVAAGGTSGSPTAFSGFDSATHKMTLSLTKTLSGASSGLGQTTHCVVVFTLV